MRFFDDMAVWLGVILVILAIVGSITLIEYVLKSNQCGVRADGLALNHDYSVFGGCRVQINNRLVPIEMIRVTETGAVVITQE